LEISITEVTGTSLGKRLARVVDVLACVGGARLDDDGAGRDAEGGSVLGVMDGFAARKPGCRGRAVAARLFSDDERHALAATWQTEPDEGDLLAVQLSFPPRLPRGDNVVRVAPLVRDLLPLGA
jgi:hypothetical protein